MKKNINDIAKMAGVSIATVSRALNNKGPVRETTRQNIIRIAQELNYGPLPGMPSTGPHGTVTLGVILPELVDDFYTSIIRGIDKEAYAADCRILVSSSHSQRGSFECLARSLTACHVDGLILMAPTIYDELPTLLKELKLPVVLLNAGLSSGPFASFRIDNYQGAVALCEHLIGHGYTRLGIIQGPQGNCDAQERFQGFQDTLRNHDLELPPALIAQQDFTTKGGYYGFTRLMSQQQKPEAIFCSNDMMALGAYEAAKSLGLDIPGNVAVTGFDDIYPGRLVTPRLTTVHIPISEMGAKAVQHLTKMISGEINPNTPYDGLISTGLIVRESCGCTQSSAV
jgi:LacI family transcriptional regulator